MTGVKWEENLGGLGKVTQSHFLHSEAAALYYHTAVICPQISSHLSRMIHLAIVCMSDSSEKTTRLNIELMSLQRLE